MGLIFIDGFDHEATETDLLTKWSGFLQNNNMFVLSAATTPFGIGQSLTPNNALSGGIYKNLPASLGRVIFGSAVYTTAGMKKCEWRLFSEVSPVAYDNNLLLSFNPITAAIDVYNGNYANLLGSTPNGSLPANTWAYVEMDATIDSVAGTVAVNINGINQLTLAGVNTAPTNPGVQCIAFQHDTNQLNLFFIDDFYILDPAGAIAPYNAMLGGCRVQTLYPTANDVVQWTPLAGTNFSEVNAAQFNGGATYNSAGTVGFQDTLAVNALYTNPISIFAVAVTGAYAEDTPAAGIAVENIIKSGATVANGVSTPVPALGTYAYDQDIFQADPATAAAWLAAGVNAVKIGYNRTA